MKESFPARPPACGATCYWYRYELVPLLDTYAYVPPGALPNGGYCITPDPTSKQCTSSVQKSVATTITTQNDLGVDLKFDYGGVSFKHSESEANQNSVAVNKTCFGDPPPPGSAYAAWTTYQRSQFVVYKYLMPDNILVDKSYGEALVPDGGIICKTVPLGDMAYRNGQ